MATSLKWLLSPVSKVTVLKGFDCVFFPHLHNFLHFTVCQLLQSTLPTISGPKLCRACNFPALALQRCSRVLLENLDSNFKLLERRKCFFFNTSLDFPAVIKLRVSDNPPRIKHLLLNYPN